MNITTQNQIKKIFATTKSSDILLILAAEHLSFSSLNGDDKDNHLKAFKILSKGIQELEKIDQ